jgi:hypothetical protein
MFEIIIKTCVTDPVPLTGNFLGLSPWLWIRIVFMRIREPDWGLGGGGGEGLGEQEMCIPPQKSDGFFPHIFVWRCGNLNPG